MQDQVSFYIGIEDEDMLNQVVNRYVALIKKYGELRDHMDTVMDLTATHANGCPLDFERLLAASDETLFHDISGIERHLCRTTGKLQDCFLPKIRQREKAAA